MSVIGPLIALVILALGLWFVGQPLRSRVAEQDDLHDEGRIADLEAARDAKYRQIRDLEMDYRTGKLSDEEWRSIDRELRGEAVEVLHELDQLVPPEQRDAAAPEPPAAPPVADPR
ncbi:MAG: hypothetical protein JHD03_02435 [Solirubrobacteraceae bacterium]|nr:hypothetical protein [Solirubrobacteraceae bacterium]MBJ7342724.1 hypothetical protein [Solirubrobacteraceae bacterium]